MKKIEAMIPSLKRSYVVDAILQAGAHGITLIESRGKGAGDRPMVSGAKGTARYIAGYNRIDTLISIVNDSKLDAVVSAIIDAAYTGKKSDGMIFVSTIDAAYKIGTKEKVT